MINGETMAKSKQQSKYDKLVSLLEDKEFNSRAKFNRFISDNIISNKNQDKIGDYVSDKITDLTTTLTAPPGTRITNPYIGGAISNTKLSDILLDKTRSSLRGGLSKENLSNLAPFFLSSKGQNIQDQYKETGKLPSAAELARTQFLPDAVVDGKRIYEPVTDENRDKFFSDREVESIKDIILNRDLDPSVIESGNIKYSPGALASSDYISSDDRKNITSRKEIGNIRESLGRFNYGHYDKTGKWQAGIPDLKGNYTIKDNYNWNRDLDFGPTKIKGAIANTTQQGINKLIDYLGLPSFFKEKSNVRTGMLEDLFQTFGPLEKRGEGRKIEFTVPTYKDNPMGLMNVLSSRLGPYKDSSKLDESLYSNYLGLPNNNIAVVPGLGSVVTPLGQGDLPGFGWQEDAFYTDDTDDAPTETEDPGYYDEDIDLRGGGQISQGLDNLYMKKRNEPKEKLYDMMGYKERQYGGGLDDAYMNRRRSSAFAAPDATSAFASPMSMGGLPTIYRDVGGTADPGQGGDFNTTDEEDSYSDEGIGYNFNDSDTSFDPYPSVDPGLAQGLSGVAPSAPSTPIDLSMVETYGGPVYDKSGNIIEGGGTFDPDRPYDSGTGKQPWFPGNDPLGLYYRQGSIPINIPTTKEGALALAPWKNLVGEDALREVMARPEGIAKLQGALKEGKVNQEEFDRIAQETITLGLGAAGTGFKTYTDDEWYGENGLDPDTPRKDIEDKRDIIDKIKGLVTITGKLDENKVKELNKALNLMGGAKFEPHSGLMRAVIEGIIPTPFKAFSNITGTGEKSIGRITFPSGKTFEVGDKGSITADKGLPEVDYGNDPKKVKKRKPVQKAAAPTKKEEKKEDTTKKTGDTEQVKASNIDRLKSYMSLTGKDLSTSKKDLAITDISITEEDFT